ncbi:hypothetical protein OI18_23230 [Flavihumibacter solisilvae]|uniref:Uncharacterized protein n=2 Tax=Flavihumibacter solisilvae TaxID=1349421 RepID=A0A0C1L4Y7_9BACT|nr:hypothetical protein OI18_23230 [Flavihumibacter solisilvae]
MYSEFSFSQISADTAIKKRQLDSLEYVVYKLKDSLRKIQYEYKVLANCHSIDTIAYGRDSIIIKYKSKSDELIKIHRKYNCQSDSLYDYEKVEYLNSFDRPEFVEHWEQARSSDDENGGVFKWKVYSYERFDYDSSGRVITWIKFYPALSRRRVQRYDYFYSSNGAQSFLTTRIKIEMFWDK